MKILIGTLSGCAVLAVVGAAVANAPGVYVGGGLALRGTVGELQYVGLAAPLRPTFDEGPAYVVNLGYRLLNNVRVEAELGYGSNNADTKASGYTGKLEQWTGMLNIAYDMPITDRLSLSVGGGGGYVKTLGHLTHSGSDYLHGGDFAPVWQAKGGVAYQVSDQLELHADYRYQEYGTSQHGSDFPAFNPVRFQNAHSHAVMIGLRWFPQPLNYL